MKQSSWCQQKIERKLCETPFCWDHLKLSLNMGYSHSSSQNMCVIAFLWKSPTFQFSTRYIFNVFQLKWVDIRLISSSVSSLRAHFNLGFWRFNYRFLISSSKWVNLSVRSRPSLIQVAYNGRFLKKILLFDLRKRVVVVAQKGLLKICRKRISIFYTSG